MLQSTSGVSVNPDVQRSFQRLSDSKEYRYILFKIEVYILFLNLFIFLPSLHSTELVVEAMIVRLFRCLSRHQPRNTYPE